MRSGTGATPEELKRVVAALDVLLATMIRHRREQGPETVAPSPLRWRRDFKNLLTQGEADVASLLSDPVEGACRQAVRRLGQHLFALGGIPAMDEAMQTASDRDLKRSGERLAIMDSAWNGVGSEEGRWWA